MHKQINRKTLAKTLRVYREVVCPTQKHIEDLFTEITIWENKVRDLEKVEKQELPEMVKMAALTELCPEDIRDLIYQQADEAVGYKKVKEKVVGWTSNRLAAKVTAVDLPVGQVGNLCKHAWEGNGDWAEPWEEYDVNMMGKCYGCGGVGHPHRLCPSKGIGKGMEKG